MTDAPNIHVLGPVDYSDIPAFYRFLDCFVLPSRFEAFPMTILEAMASGCAVVATDVGGIPEIFGENQECGLLFPVGNGEQLIHHLTSLSKDITRKERLVGNSRVRVEKNFSLQQMTNDALSVYTGVHDGRGLSQ